MAERQWINTEVGLSLPKTSKWERMAMKVVLKVTRKFTKDPEIREGIDDINTLIDVGDDFEKGKVSATVSHIKESATNQSQAIQTQDLLRMRRTYQSQRPTER